VERVVRLDAGHPLIEHSLDGFPNDFQNPDAVIFSRVPFGEHYNFLFVPRYISYVAILPDLLTVEDDNNHRQQKQQ
jgi:hypothetical protein